MQLPPARATVALVALPVITWILIELFGAQEAAWTAGAFVPARAAGVLPLPMALPVWLTPLSATLLHANALHLGFNMLMLGFCGRFVEMTLRPAGLMALFVVGAYAAAAAQYLANPIDPSPMIGASGAVSAVFAAYALLFGRERAALGSRTLNRWVNILWLAAAWIGLQLLIGVAMPVQGGSIAIFAHVGGFIAGLLLATPLLRFRYRNA